MIGKKPVKIKYGESPTLSLCMIVKNEAENIAQCIRSVKPVVDEIIVVDTGSTDNTREIAKELVVKLFDFQWCDDFAAARKESIRHSTGYYIFWFDADDRILYEDRKGLRLLKDRLPFSKDMACRLRILNQQTNGETAVNYQLRIFPNVKGVCFEGCVHEDIAESLNRLGIKIRNEDIHIIHTGYSDEETIRARAARNLSILINSTQNRDKTPSEYYHFAQSYFGIKDYRRCIEYLEMAGAAGKGGCFNKHSFSMAADSGDMIRRSYSDNDEELIRIHNQRGEELFNAGKFKSAKIIFEQILSKNPNLIEPLNNLGVIGFQKGEIDQAISYFTRVLETDENYFEAIENLGKCAEAQKDYLKATEWFERALKLKPDEIGLLNAMGNSFIQAENLSKAREVYKKSLSLDGGQENIKVILRELESLEDAKNNA